MSALSDRLSSLVLGLLSLKWGDWFYMLFSAGISAAATTLAANPLATAFGAQQFTLRQLGIMALSAALVAMFSKLQKSPLPDREIAIALMPGVHTPEQVEKISKATAPGVTPSQDVVAAILASPDSNKGDNP